MCSAIGDQLSSFNDELIDLKNISFNDTNCPILLLSECSTQSYFAVFVQKLVNKHQYGFKVFYRNDFIEYSPVDDNSSAMLTINGKESVSVTGSGVNVGGI